MSNSETDSSVAKARDKFGQYLAAGIAVMLGAHVFINIGMTISFA